MPTSFLQNRENIMEILWAAQDKAAPDYDSVELASAGKAAARGLEKLLSKEAKGQPKTELALTWRYLGDAWFCASRKTDQDCIGRSVDAYEHVEDLLADSGREVDLAKLHFNHANALRQVTGDGQHAGLEKAQKLYAAALVTFRKLLPDGVAATEASLRDVQTALRAYEIVQWGQKDRDRVQQLRQKLVDTDPADDLEVRRQISREIDAMKADDATDDFRSLMGTLSTYRPDDEKKGSWEKQLPELDETSAEMREKKATDMDEPLAYLRKQLAAALQEANLPAARAESLKRFMAEAEGLTKLSPQTAKGRATFEGKVRDLVLRAKPVLLSRSRG